MSGRGKCSFKTMGSFDGSTKEVEKNDIVKKEYDDLSVDMQMEHIPRQDMSDYAEILLEDPVIENKGYTEDLDDMLVFKGESFLESMETKITTEELMAKFAAHDDEMEELFEQDSKVQNDIVNESKLRNKKNLDLAKSLHKNSGKIADRASRAGKLGSVDDVLKLINKVKSPDDDMLVFKGHSFLNQVEEKAISGRVSNAILGGAATGAGVGALMGSVKTGGTPDDRLKAALAGAGLGGLAGAGMGALGAKARNALKIKKNIHNEGLLTTESSIGGGFGGALGGNLSANAVNSTIEKKKSPDNDMLIFKGQSFLEQVEEKGPGMVLLSNAISNVQGADDAAGMSTEEKLAFIDQLVAEGKFDEAQTLLETKGFIDGIEEKISGQEAFARRAGVEMGNEKKRSRKKWKNTAQTVITPEGERKASGARALQKNRKGKKPYEGRRAARDYTKRAGSAFSGPSAGYPLTDRDVYGDMVHGRQTQGGKNLTPEQNEGLRLQRSATERGNLLSDSAERYPPPKKASAPGPTTDPKSRRFANIPENRPKAGERGSHIGGTSKNTPMPQNDKKLGPISEPKSTISSPKAEVPKAEAPKAEVPKAEAPKAEAPKAEAPKAEAPKAEAPKAEPKPTTSAPKTTTKPSSGGLGGAWRKMGTGGKIATGLGAATALGGAGYLGYRALRGSQNKQKGFGGVIIVGDKKNG